MTLRQNVIYYGTWGCAVLGLIRLISMLLLGSGAFWGTALQASNAAGILLELITGIVYFVWQYHAVKLRYDTVGFGTSPGWSVGFWFVPIASLFKPYEIVKELSASVQSHRMALVGPWWIVHVFANITGNFSLFDASGALLFTDISGALAFIASVLFIFVFKAMATADQPESNIEHIFA